MACICGGNFLDLTEALCCQVFAKKTRSVLIYLIIFSGATPKKAQAEKLKKAVEAAAEEGLDQVAVDGKKAVVSKKGTSPKKGAKAKKTKKK